MIDLSIDEAEAEIIFDFFFGKKRPKISSMTDLDRSFAQALFVEGLERTKQLSWIETLYRGGGRKISLPKIGRHLAKKFLSDDSAKIDISVKRTITDNFDDAYKLRVYTGKYQSYGRQ